MAGRTALFTRWPRSAGVEGRHASVDPGHEVLGVQV